MKLNEQRNYWNREAATAHFALGFDLDTVAARLPTSARVLDLGCGYGRSLEQLAHAGYRDLAGLDPSPEMIDRARERIPHADLAVLSKLPSSGADASFDLILLVAVLTCVPGDPDQRELIDEAARLLAPGGLVCVTDFLIVENERNRPRYEAGPGGSFPYGVFDTVDGARHRHHDRDWIEGLLARFSRVTYREVEVETRRGNPGLAFEYIGASTNG
jgi:SAM-dependent methyltransferase